jgi:hypothetical protein
MSSLHVINYLINPKGNFTFIKHNKKGICNFAY